MNRIGDVVSLPFFKSTDKTILIEKDSLNSKYKVETKASVLVLATSTSTFYLLSSISTGSSIYVNLHPYLKRAKELTI